MTDNDTSDEAMEDALSGYSVHKRHLGTSRAFKDGWREAVRRGKAQMEERERKAFEAGFLARNMKWNWVEAYRAFKEKK